MIARPLSLLRSKVLEAQACLCPTVGQAELVKRCASAPIKHARHSRQALRLPCLTSWGLSTESIDGLPSMEEENCESEDDSPAVLLLLPCERCMLPLDARNALSSENCMTRIFSTGWPADNMRQASG